MINKVILMGRVGQDPQIRRLENGRMVASVTLATQESLPTAAGPRREITEWHRLEMWDKLAEIAEKYINKGRVLYIEGKIRTDKYTDTQGVEKQVKKIRVSSLQLMPSMTRNNNTNNTTNQEKPTLTNENDENMNEIIDQTDEVL